MKLLLDTHTFLWFQDDPEQLSAAARTAILNPDNEVWLSVASAWEMSIKAAAGRLNIPANLEEVLVNDQIDSLNIRVSHALTAAQLPDHHRDPFDRMMVAQASIEQMVFVTRDKLIPRYGVPCLKA